MYNHTTIVEWMSHVKQYIRQGFLIVFFLMMMSVSVINMGARIVETWKYSLYQRDYDVPYPRVRISL